MTSFFRAWVCLLLLVSSAAIAAPAWTIVANKSSLSFTAIQNNAPATAHFNKFTGKINFDPEKLASSHVRIVVEMASVDADYEDLVATLKMAEWFDVEKYPQAVFESNKFSKLTNGEYQASGKLTIRDKTQPVTLTFRAKKLSSDQLNLEGGTSVERLKFGVGQGEWASTDEIDDKVKIQFDITLHKS